MRVLFIGDIVGKPGRMAVRALLPNLTEKYKIDFVVANGENIAGGFGLTEALVTDLFKTGVHVVTTGNHVWDKKEIIPYVGKENRLIRPINYPPGVPGFGSIIFSLSQNLKVAVMNVAGRVFMNSLDCPFRTAKAELENLSRETNIILIDFHAEATSEKIAFGHFVDGKASAVIGTHTHVQTADEAILPKGTAYITDVGMTGPTNSIIGVEINQVIHRFLTGMPVRFETGQGEAVLSAVVIEINKETGRATAIQRLQIKNP